MQGGGREAISSSLLHHHPHSVQQPSVLIAGGLDINTCGFYIAVPQYICKLGYIVGLLIEASGKQMTDIMRIDLCGIYAGGVTELFHGVPDVATVEWLSACCFEYTAGENVLAFTVT